jgi:uncharacterized protein YegP (UPF0339 family)
MGIPVQCHILQLAMTTESENGEGWDPGQTVYGIPKSSLPEGPRIGADRFPTHYEVFQKLDLIWYWQLWSATHDLVANSNQGYERKEDCLAFIALVKSTANDPVWDLSESEE